MNKPNIITKLTEQVINELYIHDTFSSLRRFCAIVDIIWIQDETNDVPRLIYVYDEGEWTIHACMPDLLKYIYIKLGKLAPLGNPDVILQWDPNHIGDVLDINYPIDVFYYPGSNNGILVYNGYIKYYDIDNEFGLPEGYRVGAMIKIKKYLLNKYHDSNILIGWDIINFNDLNISDDFIGILYYGETDIPYKFIEYDEDNYGLIIYPSVHLGMEIPLWCTWDANHKDFFTIAVTNESSLRL